MSRNICRQSERVYPRVCGGTAVQVKCNKCQEGLSPRVRGNQPRRSGQWCTPRSIPACAGEPRQCRQCPRTAQVYPRVCGGTLGGLESLVSSWGLSPRVRGNLGVIAYIPDDRRSIPACAGEPVQTVISYPTDTVYPRVCGGTAWPCIRFYGGGGLSPRVRGNRPQIADPVNVGGSIPACAGEPTAPSPRPPQKWVYPRVCGGTSSRKFRADNLEGLSPRVRGNQVIDAIISRRRRSIPACAGEPTTAGPFTRRWTVYPRVCGGTAGACPRCRPQRGLSPRVRGNRRRRRPPAIRGGSIPACAGELIAEAGGRAIRGVYPRVCGGTSVVQGLGGGPQGLSPRVRGNRGAAGFQRLPGRSIPACAGEPLGDAIPDGAG